MSAITPPAEAPSTPAPAGPQPMGPRHPWLAAVITFFVPGLGHVYAGRARRGAVVAVGGLLLGVGALEASMHAPRPALRIAALAVVAGVLVGIIVDGWRVARHAAPDRPRPWYLRSGPFVALLVAGLLAGAVAQEAVRMRWRSFVLHSHPMVPTLHPGDYLITARGIRSVHRGDVVTRLGGEGAEFITRVVALEGDTVAMAGGVLSVNGEMEPGRTPLPASADAPLEAEWHRDYVVADATGYAPTLLAWGPLVVPPGHVFTLGDNRVGSLDSRSLGFVPADAITGRAGWIYFSREPLTGGIRWERIGREVR